MCAMATQVDESANRPMHFNEQVCVHIPLAEDIFREIPKLLFLFNVPLVR